MYCRTETNKQASKQRNKTFWRHFQHHNYCIVEEKQTNKQTNKTFWRHFRHHNYCIVEQKQPNKPTSKQTKLFWWHFQHDACQLNMHKKASKCFLSCTTYRFLNMVNLTLTMFKMNINLTSQTTKDKQISVGNITFCMMNFNIVQDKETTTKTKQNNTKNIN